MNSPKLTIYVVVEVSFDYYRFQENVGVALDIESARKIAEAYREKPRRVGNSLHYFNRGVEIVEDRELSYGQLQENEHRHLFIEAYELA
jgi:hypothetical protein